MSEIDDKRTLILDAMWPALKAERVELARVDKWYRWEHERPHSPRLSTREYRQLSERAQTPWLHLVVTAVAQALYVEGYRQAKAAENARSWDYWQRNRMDFRQIAVHRAALAYGTSYTLVTPGEDQLTGDSMPVIRGVDPSEMTAFYNDPGADEYAAYALRIESVKGGFIFRLYDDNEVWRFDGDTAGGSLTFIDVEAHEVGVCPVVRFVNTLDLRARSDGEVAPLIPLAGRIDQTVFDRLVVQRFASWKVRTISGMSPPDPASSSETSAAAKLRLAVEDILVAEDPDTKFGTLDSTPLDGFISAKDADIRDLAAVSQTPPHHLLGSIANLSAEALAAAEASLTRKIDERQHGFGESWEQTLRLAAWIDGNDADARDFAAQVRWKDTESRSLAQAADALGKLATMLNVPVEVLWGKIPGWTDQDVELAKSLADSGGGVEAMLQQLVNGQTTKTAPAPAPAFTGS